MIAGRLVRLRPVSADDLPAMRRWMSNPLVMQFWGHMRPFVTERAYESDLQGRFASFEHAGHLTILDPDGTAIGRVFYEDLDTRARSATLGILIGEESAWGKGYGPDAMIALMRHLYYDRGLHRLELDVFTSNLRAVKAYEKIGFTHEGTLRDHRYVDGSYWDSYRMSMLRSEFEARFPPSGIDSSSLSGLQIDHETGAT
jgi:RimJ/RimL family protein N-acetyltransferase